MPYSGTYIYLRQANPEKRHVVILAFQFILVSNKSKNDDLSGEHYAVHKDTNS